MKFDQITNISAETYLEAFGFVAATFLKYLWNKFINF